MCVVGFIKGVVSDNVINAARGVDHPIAGRSPAATGAELVVGDGECARRAVDANGLETGAI